MAVGGLGRKEEKFDIMKTDTWDRFSVGCHKTITQFQGSFYC